MNFYDTDRIVRKQKKYEKTAAYNLIKKVNSKFKVKQDKVDALNVLLKNAETETRQDIIKLAIFIVETKEG